MNAKFRVSKRDDFCPFCAHTGAVQSAWIDANDHVNVAYYVVAFDQATDDFDFVGLTSGIGKPPIARPTRLKFT